MMVLPAVCVGSLNACENVAVTDSTPDIVTSQVVEVSLLAPPHRLKTAALPADAVSVTVSPLVKLALHVGGQLIPGGALVTAPAAEPPTTTVSEKLCSANVAVTAVTAVTVITQVPVPLHPPPLQPVNTEPGASVAISVTAVPLTKLAVQVAPQSIPVGLLVTVPAPGPAVVTVTAKLGVKVAVTAVAAVIVSTHVAVPLQPPPLQPVNADPAAGIAVSVTTVPALYVSEQSAPQAIPAGLLVTVPPPVPALVTVSVNCLRVKEAVTDFAASIVSVHAPVPVHAPLHPVKSELAAAVAVSVTTVPAA